MEVRLTATILEVFHERERVASHIRSYKKYAFTTLPEHMSPGHRGYAERNAQQLLRRAAEFGAATEELFRQILASRPHPEQGYRSCLVILQLAKLHGPERLERASQTAIQTRALSYRRVQAILNHQLKDVPATADPGPSIPISHANIRGAGYYQDQEEIRSC